jgi:membrane protease YdiL (CAAX protease family)
MTPSWRWQHVGVFLVLLAIFTAIGASLAIISGNLFGAKGYYVQLIMWSPAAAATLTALVANRPLRVFGWKWGDWKWQLLAWLTPLAYVSIAYGLIWSMGWGTVPNPDFVADAAKSVGLHIPAAASALLMVFLTATLGMLDFAGALGEEIGWRGFLAPALFQLTNRNFTATVLINAVIWACWHAPVIFFSSYNNPGVPRWYSFGCFVILNIGGATIADWFRLRSGSLWTGVLLHNSHNILVQVIFTPLTVSTGKTQYFIDEFGIVLPLVMFAFAIYFWMRRKELSLPKSEIGTNMGADIQAQVL